jgi:hypothetical protein
LQSQTLNFRHFVDKKTKEDEAIKKCTALADAEKTGIRMNAALVVVYAELKEKEGFTKKDGVS